ncbi:MAG: elongation factor G [Phycisphaerales bacterium]
MAVLNVTDLHNVALVGHGACGKTTLAERLLFATGAIGKMGSVEKGDTVSDWTDEEKHHKHSITSAVMRFTHQGRTVNLIDTPGQSDFVGQAVAVLPAVDTVAVVVDAVKGVESTTRRLMSVAGDRKIPRFIIVNKIDAAESHPEQVIAAIRKSFGNECLPVNLPAGGGKKVVDVFEHASGDEPDYWSIPEAHKAILEQVVEVDEALTEQYLEQGENLPADKVRAAFVKAVDEGHLIPICFVSARTGAGVDELLHILEDLCPTPADARPPRFEAKKPDGSAAAFDPRPDPAGKAIAHVFKVTIDPFVGKLSFFRVHSGTVKAKSEMQLGEHRKPVRFTHIFRTQGKDHQEVHEIGPGDIGAVSKIDDLHYNAVMHEAAEHAGVVPAALAVPRPMFGLAVDLKNHADEAKFANACARLREEDPCLALDRIAATKQMVLRGMGELHLRVVLEKLKKQFNIELITSKPKTAYKETITAKADGHHRHKKQTGGAGQFGEVYLRIEPLPTGHPEGFEFVSEVVGGNVPRQYWPAVEKGVRQVMNDGAIAGYPMSGVRVALYDGKYHDVDSKEIAFVTAGRKAFIDAVSKARPKLLEPYVLIEVTAPAKYMGDLAGHISTKRGRIQDTQMLDGDTCIVRAQAPLAELQNYSNELKSMTAGAGSYTMDYSHDEPTPPQIQQEVVAAFKPRADED